MAVGVLIEFPGTAEQYDQVNEKMGMGDDQPQGMLVHTAAEVEDGSMRIMDVWESADAFESFSENRLGPAVGEVVGELQPSRREIFELHNFVRA